ncbi:MAG TPA: hypothetical protein VN512_01030 [Clostridia bacterium]|nr:hypothetical protein [Clostridia bacterium]
MYAHLPFAQENYDSEKIVTHNKTRQILTGMPRFVLKWAAPVLPNNMV